MQSSSAWQSAHGQAEVLICARIYYTSSILSWIKNLCVGRAKNAKMWKVYCSQCMGLFCLTTFSSVHSKRVPWRFRVRRPSYSSFFHWVTQRGHTIVQFVLVYTLCSTCTKCSCRGSLGLSTCRYRWSVHDPDWLSYLCASSSLPLLLCGVFRFALRRTGMKKHFLCYVSYNH